MNLTKTDLKPLLESCPLPCGVRDFELFSESFELDSLVLHLVGLCTTLSDGTTIAGSAAASDGPPKERAYFEFVERLAVREAELVARNSYRVIGRDGHQCGDYPRSVVFPQSPTPGQWMYSKSNGIAVHTDLSQACAAAAYELFERDAVLRSWYGGFVPKAVGVPGGWSTLSNTYNAEAYLLTPAVSDAPAAAVFCLFPKVAQAPLVYGFGAGAQLDSALGRAQGECLQRLAFLWGERAESEPPFSPTPDYHQEVFLQPAGISMLRRWLDGKNAVSVSQNWVSPLRMERILFIDLTPPQLVGRLWVVKAISGDAIPLIFGRHPYAGERPEVTIHPVA